MSQTLNQNQYVDVIIQQIISEGLTHIFITSNNHIYEKINDLNANYTLIANSCPKTVAMAALGFSQASLKPSVIILNDFQQVIEAYPAIYAAFLTNIPLVIIYFNNSNVGLAHAKHNFAKKHYHVDRLDDLSATVRKAFFKANCLPRGPITIQIDRPVLKQSITNSQSYLPPQTNSFNQPDINFVKKIAQVLFNATNPIIIVGDEINHCGSRREAENLAKILACPVYGESTYTSVNFSTNHEFFLGHLDDDFNSVLNILENHDVIMLIGVKYPSPSLINNLRFNPNQRLIIQLNLDFTNVMSDIPSYLNLIADLSSTLLKIQNEIQTLVNQNWMDEAKERKNKIITQNLNLLQSLKSSQSSTNITLTKFLNNLSQVKPSQDPVVAWQGLKIHNYSICFAWTSSSSYYSLASSGQALELSQAIGIALACNSSQSVIVISPIEAISEYLNPMILANSLGLKIKFIFVSFTNNKVYVNYLKYFNVPSFNSTKDVNQGLKKIFENEQTIQAINIVLEK